MERTNEPAYQHCYGTNRRQARTPAFGLLSNTIGSFPSMKRSLVLEVYYCRIYTAATDRWPMRHLHL